MTNKYAAIHTALGYDAKYSALVGAAEALCGAIRVTIHPEDYGPIDSALRELESQLRGIPINEATGVHGHGATEVSARPDAHSECRKPELGAHSEPRLGAVASPLEELSALGQEMQPEQYEDPWKDLAMLTNDEIKRAMDAKMQCCIGGHVSDKCCDCMDLRNSLIARAVSERCGIPITMQPSEEASFSKPLRNRVVGRGIPINETSGDAHGAPSVGGIHRFPGSALVSPSLEKPEYPLSVDSMFKMMGIETDEIGVEASATDQPADAIDIQKLRDAGVIHVTGKGELTKRDVEFLLSVADLVKSSRSVSSSLEKPVRHVEIPANNYYLNRCKELADTPTPKAQQGTWTLTAPDGRQWQAENPLKACRLEQMERVPADVGFARIAREVNSPDEPVRTAVDHDEPIPIPRFLRRGED